MYCLYNGEYGEHDIPNFGGLEKIVDRQKESYKAYQGMIVGDYTILSVEYDWGKRSQRAEIECNFCHKKQYLYHLSDWRRGKGRSTKCECHKIRDNIDKLLEPEKTRRAVNNNLEWIGKESNGWKIISYSADYEFLIECIQCGKTKHIKPYMFKNGSLEKCKHITVNDYSDEKWIGQKNGNLTALFHDGTYFTCKCDCGNIVKVRGTDLFRKRSATSCKNIECPYYKESNKSIVGAVRRKEGLLYEHSAQDLFEKNGYVVERTPDSQDYGVDYIVHLNNGEKLAIQCKKSKAPASVRAIQEVYTGGHFYDCCLFAVISPSGFTKNALSIALKLGVYCAIHEFKFDDLYSNKKLLDKEV